MYFFKDDITSSKLAIVYNEDMKNIIMSKIKDRFILFFIKTSKYFLSLAKIIQPVKTANNIPILSTAVDINIKKNEKHNAYPHILSFIL